MRRRTAVRTSRHGLDAAVPPARFALKLAANHNIVARSGRWKYIHPMEGPAMIQWGPKVETGNAAEPQLYDMTASPAETDNRAAGHPKQVKAFQELIQKVSATKGCAPERPIK